MGQVLIRNLDDAVIATYRELAKANGRSLEAELRDALARGAARPSRAEIVALSRAVRAMTGGKPGQTPGWELIREDRDTR